MKILSEILNLKKNYQSVSAKYYQANEAIQKIKISHILREIWQHFSGGLIEEWWTCIEQVECISGHWKMRKKFFSVRTAEHGKRLPRMTVECPSLEMLKNCLDTILSNMSGEVGVVSSNLPCSMILWLRSTSMSATFLEAFPPHYILNFFLLHRVNDTNSKYKHQANKKYPPFFPRSKTKATY